MLTYSCQSCLDSGQIRVAALHRFEPCPDCAPPVKGETNPRVFIVIGSTGCYEEHQEWISSVHATEAGAQKRITEMQARLKVVRERKPITDDYKSRCQWWELKKGIDTEGPLSPDVSDMCWWIEVKEVNP